jgi:23S rRNA (cytosine1962-C5)-methyltransferase
VQKDFEVPKKNVMFVLLPPYVKDLSMLELSPTDWTEYELIDSGGFEKLERFGKYVLRRPEPQAVWNKALSEADWERAANAWFKRAKGKDSSDNERGEWLRKSSMPDQWFIEYHYRQMHLKFRLGMTSFKHVGLFPEQASNWNFIYDKVSSLDMSKPKVLNLFAYTGGASLAACAAGAEVVHVDSVRQVVTWSRENMEASGLDGIRWIVEDAMKFVQREIKRGKRYEGIILDPPAYGRGPDGEKWVLEENIAPFLQACSQLLDAEKGFLILNLYSMGFSAIIAKNLLSSFFPQATNIEYGELVVREKSGNDLPLSIFARF